jgi:hypothetical protein
MHEKTYFFLMLFSALVFSQSDWEYVNIDFENARYNIKDISKRNTQEKISPGLKLWMLTKLSN